MRYLMLILFTALRLCLSAQTVSEFAIAEYKSGAIDDIGRWWAPYWVSGQGTKMVQLGGALRFTQIDGGQYNQVGLSTTNDVYIQSNGSTTLQSALLDTFNVAFKATYVECYFQMYIAIRDDGTIWARGYNHYRWFGSNINTILNKWTKIPGQPAGITFTKTRKGGAPGSGMLLALSSTGTVYTVADNTTTWSLKSLPGTVTNIYASYNGFYLALIAGKPYGWGQGKYLRNVTGNISTFEALDDDWGLNSPNHTIIDMAVNDNTIHYITDDNKLWGMGDNAAGEVGIGYQLVNRREYYAGTQYVWNWLNPTLGNYQATIGSPPLSIFVFPAQQLSVGKSFSRVWASDYFAFYCFAKEVSTNSIYFWGRNKGAVGFTNQGWSNEATLPNAGDRVVPTLVNVFTSVTPAPSNFVPGTVTVGNDQAIAVNTTTLTGSATPGHTNGWTYSIASYSWTKLSGPSCTIATPNAATTQINSMANGSYTFMLRVTDNNTATMTDTINVTVAAIPPRIVASASYTGNGTASLTSSITSPDGIRRIMWSILDRPGTQTYKIFVGGSSTFAGTGANVVDSGVIRKVKRFWQSHGLVDTLYERAIGGRDTRHGLPVNASSTNTATVTNYDSTRSVTAATRRGVHLYMNGYPSNNYGDPTTIANHITWWKETRDSAIAGGAEFWLGTTQPRTDGSAPAARFRSAADSVRANFPNNYVEHYRSLVIPNGTSIRPELSFGDNIHTNVAGHTILASNWIGTNPLRNLAKGTAVFANASAQNTTVSGLTQGLWKIIAAVEDTNGIVSYQVVELDVPAIPTNTPPVADAGDDVVLIGSSVTLDGSLSYDPDPSGSITTYSWGEVAESEFDFIAQPSSPITRVDFTSTGTYTYRLTVFDNEGASSSDDVVVTVMALNFTDNIIFIHRRSRKKVIPTIIP